MRRIKVGEYEIIEDLQNKIFKALRHGENWKDLIGNNLIMALIDKIEELEENLKGDNNMKVCLLMKNNSFKLICNNCGNMAELKDNTSNEDYNGKFSFYPIQNERISIYCQKCDNEVFIDEDYFSMM